MADQPRRGDVWWVDFDPSVGTEVQKTRPAVVVSNDRANSALNRFQVVPLTTNLKKFYAGNAHVTISGRQSRAMADQLFTAARERFGRRLGRLSGDDMLSVDDAIRVQLAL
ncbi:type II toxin-antitoxin system PemK/MazF family toxin [Brevundimonas aurifodinae]|uniref:mRNA interferase n=1 Tax=Brevundimonas aurifodinae TaxID=1508312 RepID=A0ABV1NPV3_9CAUL|nr:MAG: growth inhibitor PemK [Brevundimonas sp. 12-68-7]